MDGPFSSPGDPAADRRPDESPDDDRRLFAPRELPPLGPDASADGPAYRDWVRNRLADPAPPAGPGGPAVTLVLVLDDPRPPWLRRSLRALTRALGPGDEVALATVGRLAPEAARALDEELVDVPAAVGVVRAAGPSPARAGAAAVAATRSPLVVLVGQHDELEPDARARLVAGLGEAVGCYGDEDRIDDVGAAGRPWFKPDWSPDLLLGAPYVGRPLLVRRTALAAAGGIVDVEGGDWEHDLMLRVGEQGPLAHVPEVLYHRRSPEAPPERPVAGPAAVERALARRSEPGSVEPGPLPGTWTIARRLSGRPTVSVIIPFRDGARLLRTCVDTVTATTGLPVELVLVDNGSTEPETLTLVDTLAARPDVTVVEDPRPFNWAALNNGAARQAGGDVLVFLNNDIEARRPQWLEPLVAQALRPEVGAVGARLLYPDGRVQHAGVVVGLGGAAGHVLGGLAGDEPGYGGLAVLTRNCSGVTGACLAVRPSVFFELGAFDESLGLDLNDVDYCLRAIAAGYRVVYEPAAELVHHESPTRGTSGSARDIRRFVDRWQSLIERGDPLLGQNLTRVDSSCGLRRPDETKWWQEWRSTLDTV